MKERPLLCCGSMVRAIIEGRKTQTRRVMKPQPSKTLVEAIPEWNGVRFLRSDGSSELVPCPYGGPGDRIWVRETHYRWGRFFRRKWRFYAKAVGRERDGGLVPAKKRTEEGWHRRPSIFMPHDRHCLTLEITAVRVERLQEITHTDCTAEGLNHYGRAHWSCPGTDEIFYEGYLGFKWLWDSLNAKRAFRWDKNPWVWVITFKRI